MWDKRLVRAAREAVWQSWDTVPHSRMTASEGHGLPPQEMEGRGRETSRGSHYGPCLPETISLVTKKKFLSADSQLPWPSALTLPGAHRAIVPLADLGTPAQFHNERARERDGRRDVHILTTEQHMPSRCKGELGMQEELRSSADVKLGRVSCIIWRTQCKGGRQPADSEGVWSRRRSPMQHPWL